MKYSIYLFVLLFIGLSFSHCKGPVSERPEILPAETESGHRLRGQAGVADDESEKDILRIALASKVHSTLVAAVQAAEMEHVLSNAGPLTVFAPTNAAFDKLPAGTLEELLKPENKARLANIITFHAAPGSYDPGHVKGVMGIGQATGDKVNVEVLDGVTTINGAKILASIKASNGYVHVIDGVLLPPE
ncbi:MAG: fasciclin domain-containing protein [Saprospiraceae bacterium]|nr:fasciclin domain-containing protein [Saprospiraceae bacterium]